MWKGSANGVPTAKAFFNFINKSIDEESNLEEWMWIWKLGCTKKIRFLIWLIMRGKLLTNHYRAKIGITNSDT